MSKLETNTIDTVSGTTNLTIGSTNSSTVTFESGSATGHMSPAFHAFLNSSQSTSHSTFTTLICNSEIFDSNSAYDVSNGRFTPQKAGKYFAYANIHWESMETGTTVELEIRKNGSRSGETNLIRRNSRAGDQSIFSSIIIDMNGSSDFLTLGGLQNSGFTKNAEGGTGFQATYFGAYRIGA